MPQFSERRRQLLLSTAAWIGGLSFLASAKQAAAFETYKIYPKSELGLALANRCKVNSDHADIVAELKRELAKDPAVNVLTAECPICGCPVTVTRS